MGTRKLTAEDLVTLREDVRNREQTGRTMAEIARSYGITVQHAYRAAKVDNPRDRFTARLAEGKRSAVFVLSSKMGRDDIANVLGLSRRVVDMVLG